MRLPDFAKDEYAVFGKVRVWGTGSVPLTVGHLPLGIDEAKDIIESLAAAIAWYEARKAEGK